MTVVNTLLNALIPWVGILSTKSYEIIANIGAIINPSTVFIV
jgi:hypothetical protein